MTIAISLKVSDGIVLAADSATTVAEPTAVLNVYNNANKVFNLRKGLPIGLITWGLGSISGASISTLAKDLRRRLAGDSPGHEEWKLDRDTYAIAQVAEQVKRFMYEEKYSVAQNSLPDGGQLPSLGFIVAGYSAGSDHGEEYHLDLGPGGCSGPTLLREPHETGASWGGQPEALERLVNGSSGLLPQILATDLGVDPADIPAKMQLIRAKTSAPFVNSAMPLQDAIDLVEWMVDVSINWSRFMPGFPVVGGPIESAAISKHEGFKWVKRKHYFDSTLNPRGDP